MAVCCWHYDPGTCPEHGIKAKATADPAEADVVVSYGDGTKPWQGWESTFMFLPKSLKAVQVEHPEVKHGQELQAKHGFMGGGFALHVLKAYLAAGCKVAWYDN
jgi:hypothetical protein